MIDYLKKKEKRECSYLEIEDDQVKRLLEDRIEFKLWAAQRHLEKLNEIENFYEGIVGKYKIYAEDELIKLKDDRTSWYWRLNEFRNHVVHRRMTNKLIHISLTDDVNTGTNSSETKNSLIEPHSKTPMEEETISFLSTSLSNMRNLLTNIREKMGSNNNMINGNSMSEEERYGYIFGDHIEKSIINRFDWLEGALVDDIQTFVNAKQQRVPRTVSSGFVGVFLVHSHSP